MSRILAPLLAITLFSGCQTARRSLALKAIPLPDPKEQKTTITSQGWVIRYNEVHVNTSTEGREVLSNRRSYLLDLFHNSPEPYFGQMRWSKDCLAKNRVGEIHQEKRSTEFLSEFTVDERFNVGTCNADSYKAVLLEVYCDDLSSVFEVFARQENGESPIPTQMRVRCESPIQLELR